MVRGLFLGVLLCVTAWRVANYIPLEKRYTDGQIIRLKTTVLDTPKDWGWKKNIVVSGIVVNLPANSEVTIGDVVEIVGNIKVQVIEKNLKIISLDTDTYMKVGSEKSMRVLMAKTRSIVISRLLKWLPGDTGGLAAGILVGGDGQMSSEGVLAFRRLGISHIVAASGYNVTVVAAWAGMILERWLNRFYVMYIGILSIVLYMFLAGGTAAVVRSGIMVIMVNIGKMLGREADAGWLLVLTSLGMIIWEPAWYRDVGFQLSVAAMAGMIYLAGKSIWSQTWACQLTTLPLILHYFGDLSMVAPVANMIFLWPVPVIMPVLGIAVCVSVISPLAGGFVSWLTWPLLSYMIEGTRWIASAHWVILSVEKMSWGWVIGYYLVLIGYKVMKLNNESRN